MKRFMIALAITTALASPALAWSGGEGNNTNCNGVGNHNSPCAPAPTPPAQTQSQGQYQHQQQYQGQSQTAYGGKGGAGGAGGTGGNSNATGGSSNASSGASSSAAGGNSTGASNSNVNNQNYPSGPGAFPAAGAYSPSFALSSACQEAISVGGSMFFAGISFGRAYTLDFCKMTMQADYFRKQNREDMAKAAECKFSLARALYRETGTPCREDMSVAQLAQPAPSVQQASSPVIMAASLPRCTGPNDQSRCASN